MGEGVKLSGILLIFFFNVLLSPLKWLEFFGGMGSGSVVWEVEETASPRKKKKSWWERGESLGLGSCLSFEEWGVFMFPLRQEGSEGAQSSLQKKNNKLKIKLKHITFRYAA